MARTSSNTLRPLALFGATALALSLLLGSERVVPDAAAGQAFRTDHSAQSRFDSSRVPVLTGLAPEEIPARLSNVVLITVDSWRDRLGLWKPLDTSPFLTELAKTSLEFDRAVATSSRTWPAMV